MFPYFIYTIPLNIIACLILCALFLLLQQHKISQFLRKFYFIKSILLQTLIEGNLVYLVYVCFGHLSTAFHFRFADRLSLAFTVVFLWGIVLFSLTFYILVGRFLQSKACYFLYCYYRCTSGYFFITIKNLVRNFLRGATFYFLH